MEPGAVWVRLRLRVRALERAPVPVGQALPPEVPLELPALWPLRVPLPELPAVAIRPARHVPVRRRPSPVQTRQAGS